MHKAIRDCLVILCQVLQTRQHGRAWRLPSFGYCLRKHLAIAWEAMLCQVLQTWRQVKARQLPRFEFRQKNTWQLLGKPCCAKS